MTKQKRDRRLNMVFFQKEYDNLEKYAEESSLTVSEFIREAIRYKIRSIENPQYYNGIMKQVKNGQTKAEAKQEARSKDLELSIDNLYAKVSQDMKNLKEISKTARKRVTQKDLGIVISSLEKKEANIEELQEITYIDNETLFNILKDRKLFSVGMNGKYKLKQVSKKL